MRRQFGSGAAGLCARDGIFKAHFRRADAGASGAGGCPDFGGRILFCVKPAAGSVQQTKKPPGRNMARIDYCDTSKSNERTREILGKNRNANIFRMMAHSPSYFEQYCRLGGAIRNKGELDPVLRELAITRTGILCEAPYEVVAHKRIGGNVGVTDEQNAALDDWKAATCFDDVQRAALAFTDEIVKLRRPTDATFNAIAAKLTPAALVELQLSVGFYIMTSKFLETFDIDLQPVTEVV
jgi:alkylhydroperoxidase family enzyme